ncbi:MAG: cupin domain-containing protein [Myxococcota bacterium]
MSELDPVTNVADAPDEGGDWPRPWAGSWKVLTPNMREAGGSLGVVQNTLPPGSVGCPFHWHAREDEVFFVLSGRGVLRYGEQVREIGPGDCISCPANTRVAHQIANPFDEDLVYLAMGPYDPHEVCGYPDSGKVMVRALKAVGMLEKRDYMDGEPEEPRIFGLARSTTP